MSENLVRYGLSNVHYAVMDSDGNYGTPVAWTGAVSLSLEPDGDTGSFWADNVKYATFANNGGYTGTLEMAADNDSVLVDLLNYIDDDGLILEPTDATTVYFALMFEVAGNIREQRTVLYNCTLSRPSKDANTKTDSTDPDTVSFDFEASSVDMDVLGETRNVVKATIENSDETSDRYSTFMDSVLLPTSTAA